VPTAALKESMVERMPLVNEDRDQRGTSAANAIQRLVNKGIFASDGKQVWKAATSGN